MRRFIDILPFTVLEEITCSLDIVSIVLLRQTTLKKYQLLTNLINSTRTREAGILRGVSGDFIFDCYISHINVGLQIKFSKNFSKEHEKDHRDIKHILLRLLSCHMLDVWKIYSKSSKGVKFFQWMDYYHINIFDDKYHDKYFFKSIHYNEPVNIGMLYNVISKAAEKMNTRVIKFLCENKYDLNVLDSSGYFPLYHAIKSATKYWIKYGRFPDTAKVLIKNQCYYIDEYTSAIDYLVSEEYMGLYGDISWIGHGEYYDICRDDDYYRLLKHYISLYPKDIIDQLMMAEDECDDDNSILLKHRNSLYFNVELFKILYKITPTTYLESDKGKEKIKKYYKNAKREIREYIDNNMLIC